VTLVKDIYGRYVGYQYYDTGLRKKLDYPGTADDLNYKYDALGRVTQLKRLFLPMAEYEYDELSRRTLLTYGNDAEIEYEYDVANQLRRISNNINDGNVIEFAYPQYDKVGNRLSMKIGDGNTQVYDYDKLYQLTSVDYNDGNETKYHYDTLGNRIDVNDGTSVTYVRNALNQYTSVGGTNFTYDKNGNLTNDGTRSYTYDCENRLIRAGSLLHNFKYDYRDRLVKGRFGTNLRFTYDGDQVIAEYLESTGALMGKYIYGPGIDEPICRIHVSGGEETKYYYHYDGLGSVVALSDENANIVEKYSYDVYGKPVIRGPGDEPRTTSSYWNRYMFTGRDYDSSTGLYYYRARWYNPDIGRFMSGDQAYYSDDLNLYTYCRNNPINLVDPYGMGWRDWWQNFKDWLKESIGISCPGSEIVKGCEAGLVGGTSCLAYKKALENLIKDPDFICDPNYGKLCEIARIRAK